MEQDDDASLALQFRLRAAHLRRDVLKRMVAVMLLRFTGCRVTQLVGHDLDTDTLLSQQGSELCRNLSNLTWRLMPAAFKAARILDY